MIKKLFGALFVAFLLFGLQHNTVEAKKSVVKPTDVFISKEMGYTLYGPDSTMKILNGPMNIFRDVFNFTVQKPPVGMEKLTKATIQNLIQKGVPLTVFKDVHIFLVPTNKFSLPTIDYGGFTNDGTDIYMPIVNVAPVLFRNRLTHEIGHVIASKSLLSRIEPGDAPHNQCQYEYMSIKGIKVCSSETNWYDDYNEMFPEDFAALYGVDHKVLTNSRQPVPGGEEAKFIKQLFYQIR